MRRVDIQSGETVESSNVVKPHRDSNLELFRIILMLAIIAYHYCCNSGLNSVLEQYPDSDRRLAATLFGAWGKVGIDCFVMITGYFMCKSHITLEKFLKLLLEVLVYGVVIGVVFCLSGYVPLNIAALVDLFLPLKRMAKNFTICFLFFFLCIPFLNIVLNNINRRMHGGLLLLLLLFYTVIPSCRWAWRIDFDYISWFCVVYMLAAYIRIYPGKWSEGAAKWGAISLVVLTLSAVSVLITRSHFYLADSNKILAVAVAVSLFLFFKNLRMSYNPIVNWIAQSIFGVLLIHEHSDAMKRWLWVDTLHVVDMFGSPYFWLHAVCSVFGVFIVGTLIDHLRIMFIERPFFKHFDSVVQRVGITARKYFEA